MAVFFLASLFAYDASELPDYRTYGLIYEVGGANFILAQQDMGFVAFILLSRAAGLSYEEFRILLKIVGLALFAYSAACVSTVTEAPSQPPRRGPGLMGGILIFLATSMFLLEFLEVRIRGGLSLSLMAASFATFIKPSSTKMVTRVLLCTVLAGLSYSVHELTAVISAYLLFSPFIYHRLIFRTSGGVQRPANIVMPALIILLITAVFLLFIFSQSAFRGEHLSSPLNPVRLIILSIVPTMLAMPIISNERVGRGFFNAVKTGKFWQTSQRHFDLSRKSVIWLSVGLTAYVPLAISLMLMYLFGLTGGAGEAIVRVFTLNSIIAFFAISMWVRRYTWYWTILMALNSAFFVNTLLTPSPAG